MIYDTPRSTRLRWRSRRQIRVSRRALALVHGALTLAVLWLGACKCPPGPGASDEGKAASALQWRGGIGPDRLVIHLEVEPAHLVYMLKPDAWAYRMTAHNLFEGLIRIHPRTYELEGELARAWTVSEDGLTYTFDLRPGVRWHDGEPFSAGDVRFTLDRLLDERVHAESTRASLAAFVDRYEVLAPHRFRIVCKEPSFYFLQNLAAVMILPAHRMKQGDLNRHPLLRRPIGTGPYRFGSWRAGEQITLERFDAYWGSKPRIRTLVWRIVHNPSVALQLARRGEIGFVPRVRPEIWTSQVQGDAELERRFARIGHVSPGVAFVLINHRRELLAQRQVRRALAHLLDLDTVISKIMYGLAERATSLYWRNDPYFDASIPPIRYDPEAARKLLRQAGFGDSDRDGVLDRGPGGQALRLTFLVPAGSKSARRWLTLYQQELRKAGVELQIQAIEWKAFLERIRAKSYDLAALGMQISGSHTDLYLQLHSSQIDEGQNYAAYSNPRVDRLLEQIRVEREHPRRKALTRELQRLLAEEVPVIPLFSLRDPGLIARDVKGVSASNMWYQPRDWWIEGAAASGR